MPNGLILIDIQNDYFPGGKMELAGINEMAANAAALLDIFREKGLPTFHIQHIFETDDAPFFVAGSDGIDAAIARIERIISKLRAAGVQRIIPYVYTMAFFGHPEKRTGFFHFYDHWDEYREFGLGPKPPADPVLWSQLRGPQPLGGGPPDVLH